MRFGVLCYVHVDLWTLDFLIVQKAVNHNDNTGQQIFCPVRKMSVSDVFLDAEFKYIPRMSVSPTPFAPG